MFRYETLFLTVPTITADETAAIESQFAKLIKDLKATLVSYERWGKYRLAYPVNKHEYGVYFLTRFEVQPEQKAEVLEAVRLFFAVKYNELVMRSVVEKLDFDAPLTYVRPESLEEAPVRESNFQREDRNYARSGQNDMADESSELAD
jgi:ribosomal protein S6